MLKKIIIIISGIIIILLTLILLNKEEKNDNIKTIKVAEVTHSAFYTPFYVAIQKGYFKENNIKIDLILTSGANNVVASVLSGDVQIGLCGPEATIYVYNEGEKNFVASFAGLTKRDGQFIVSREKIENFTLDKIKNKEVLAGRPGGMPIINFYNALKNENIEGVLVNDTVDFANLSSAFISTKADFVNLFEPNATKIEQMGYGHVVASVGSYSGIVPYTTFSARIEYIKNNKDIINSFRKAINKGIDYTLNTDSKILAQDIIELFPDTSLKDMEIIIERYKKADSWFKDTNISEDSFINLENMMIDSKLIEKYVNYNDLIIND